MTTEISLPILVAHLLSHQTHHIPAGVSFTCKCFHYRLVKVVVLDVVVVDPFLKKCVTLSACVLVSLN